MNPRILFATDTESNNTRKPDTESAGHRGEDEKSSHSTSAFCQQLFLNMVSHVDSFASSEASRLHFSFGAIDTPMSGEKAETQTTVSAFSQLTIKSEKLDDDHHGDQSEEENIVERLGKDEAEPQAMESSLLVYHSPLTPKPDYLKTMFDYSSVDGKNDNIGNMNRVVLLKECIHEKYLNQNHVNDSKVLSELVVPDSVDSSGVVVGSTHIYQIKVVRQRTSAVCGYHALFNAIQGLRAFDHYWSNGRLGSETTSITKMTTSTTTCTTTATTTVMNQTEDTTTMTSSSTSITTTNTMSCVHTDTESMWNENMCPLDHMFNRTSFWFFFIRMQQLITNYALSKPKQHYPWCPKNIQLGLFEREYMKYVLDQENMQIPVIGRHRFTSIPDLSIRSLRNAILTSSQIVSVQKIFDRFQKAKKGTNMNHAFCLGAGNHWFAFVVHQHRTHRGETSIEGLYLDSRNNRLFGQSDDQLRQQVLRRLEKAEKRIAFRESEREYYIYNYLESLKDTQYSIDLILGCIRGERNFISECLSVAIRAMLDNFNDQVTQQISTSDDKSMLPLILLWIQNYYPASYIYNSIVKYVLELGSSYLNETLRREVLEWIDLVLCETSDQCIHALKTTSSGCNFSVSDADHLAKVVKSLGRAIEPA